MKKTRIVIADTDKHYIVPLQLKFIKEYFDKVDLEIITEKEYFKQFFSTSQKIDILIMAEELYSTTIQKHNIEKIFLMTEQNQTREYKNNITQIYKYTNINIIFNRIMGNSSESIIVSPQSKKDCQIILVDSACGGVGKTTIALGISACLAQNYKRALYINVAHLQMPSPLFDKSEFIVSLDLYAKLRMSNKNNYQLIKEYIKNEGFNYIPLFRSSLMSLGIDYSIYENIILSASKSKDYDFIVIDADNVFDENKSRLIEMSDKVILVTNQSKKSVFSLNTFLENIDVTNSDKYLFVCNNFKECEENYLLSKMHNAHFKINEYVKHITEYDQLNVNKLSNDIDIQKITYLII